jgi:hypothetical protein
MNLPLNTNLPPYSASIICLKNECASRIYLKKENLPLIKRGGAESSPNIYGEHRNRRLNKK